MAGHDWRDPQWVRGEPVAGQYAAQAGAGIAGLRVGVLDEALAPVGCTDDTLEAFAAAQETLTGLGATIEPVSVPLWPDAFVIEAGVIYAALHAMHVSGGQGIGHLGRIDVETMAAAAASGRLGAADLPPMLQMALVTTEFLRDKYLGVHVGKAQNLRLELRRQVTAALAGVDVLITPTIPHVATKLLDRPALPGEMAERAGLSAVANTCALDLTGHPALTVPCGTGEHGLPIGLQLIGRHFDEETLYRAAFAFEDARGGAPAVVAAAEVAA
ncbi:MAG TPA: amidase family protein, partial [Baekduia sp.]|nr:amidase family protein [Baekduia sp.]